MCKRSAIVQVVPVFQGGGGERIADELYRNCKVEGANFYYVCFGDKPQSITEDKKREFFGISPRSAHAIFKLRKYLRRLSKSHDQIIVHAHLTWPFYFVVIASLFLKVTLVYTEHSTYNKRRSIRVLQPIERTLYRRYAVTTCISRSVERELKRWSGNESKTLIIQNGIKLPSRSEIEPRAEPLTGKPKLLSVGSLRQAKGFETSIRAIAEFKEQIESYTIVGEGPERHRLELLISELGLEEKVYLRGWSNNVGQYYCDADILLVPSIWEGFGLVALEGMAYGMPVVASDVDGLNEVLDESITSVGLVKDFVNPTSWTLPIAQAIDSIGRHRFQVAEDSRKRAELFSQEKMVKQFEELYAELLGLA